LLSPRLLKSSTCPIQLPILSSSSFKDRALVCLSHLRWDLVFQRPQHLMARFAQAMPVYFVEEPAFEGADSPRLQRCEVAKNLTVLVPRMPVSMATADATSVQKRLVSNFFSANLLRAAVLWFYTPAALQFADELPAAVTVFDCMDELSSFQGASPELHRLEAKLLSRADVVFTGGISLYEAKHGRHHNVHAFPSAVDAAHFATARKPMREPADQRAIPHPRLGFFGVIDERLDRDLVADVARLRPDWQLILIGPIVKINAADLPQAPNLHYLGRKTYGELPAYIASWDAAIMPFAQNEATRFISPTKTPEYLAAGKPVVSTPILDVVRAWGQLDAVHIAATPDQFVREVEAALSLAGRNSHWLEAVDRQLERLSWDRTWTRMVELTAEAIERRQPKPLGASQHDPEGACTATCGEECRCLIGLSSGPALPAASSPNGLLASVTKRCSLSTGDRISEATPMISATRPEY
jgi:UDP-galactopyranose mutase